MDTKITTEESTMTNHQQTFLEILTEGVAENPEKQLPRLLDLFHEVCRESSMSDSRRCQVVFKVDGKPLFSMDFNLHEVESHALHGIQVCQVGAMIGVTHDAPLIVEISRLVAECLISMDIPASLTHDVATAVRMLATIAYGREDMLADQAVLLAGAAEVLGDEDLAIRHLENALERTDPSEHNYPTLVQMIWSNLVLSEREPEIVRVIKPLGEGTHQQLRDLMPKMMEQYDSYRSEGRSKSTAGEFSDAPGQSHKLTHRAG